MYQAAELSICMNVCGDGYIIFGIRRGCAVQCSRRGQWLASGVLGRAVQPSAEARLTPSGGSTR